MSERRHRRQDAVTGPDGVLFLDLDAPATPVGAVSQGWSRSVEQLVVADGEGRGPLLPAVAVRVLWTLGALTLAALAIGSLEAEEPVPQTVAAGEETAERPIQGRSYGADYWQQVPSRGRSDAKPLALLTGSSAGVLCDR